MLSLNFSQIGQLNFAEVAQSQFTQITQVYFYSRFSILILNFLNLLYKTQFSQAQFFQILKILDSSNLNKTITQHGLIILFKSIK